MLYSPTYQCFSGNLKYQRHEHNHACGSNSHGNSAAPFVSVRVTELDSVLPYGMIEKVADALDDSL
jgi:hypothetical protein